MTKDISEESFKKLKNILEEEKHRTYTMEEIREIGNDLLDFFEVLAEPASEGEEDANEFTL